MSERAQLLGDAGALLTSVGGYEEALAALGEALRLARADQPELRAALVALVARRGEARRRGGRPVEDPARLQRAVGARAGGDDEQVLVLRTSASPNVSPSRIRSQLALGDVAAAGAA